MISIAMLEIVLVIASATGSNDQEPAAVPGTRQRLSEGLVGHWKFDEPTGDRATDSSGNGLVGALINKPPRIAGVLGSALQLNGANQSVSIPHSAGLKPSRQITISAWVLPNELTAHGSSIAKRTATSDTCSHSMRTAPCWHWG